MTDEQTQEIGGGTYEVIRKRLGEQGAHLLTQTNALNERRQEVFGGTETELIDTIRVRTEHNCIPRDVISLSTEELMLGYEVFIGLKSETNTADVFSELHYSGSEILPKDSTLLADPRFQKDFNELFQYYKNAKLLQLRRTDTHILMAFQTGRKIEDIRVLRWGIENNTISYVDNRGEQNHLFPPAHAFEWTRTTRDDHVLGQHSHVTVCDTVFVECIGGDLTIKVEDNTEDGGGIYAEDVEDTSQGLDDAEILYANLENTILLKILPYRETEYRYIVYNKQTQEAVRIDAIGFSCQELPEGHGLIFPGGYYLQNGSYKVFPHQTDDMEFIRSIRAPNGEDVAYVYHHRIDGTYIILQYNMITREVTNPQICNGYSLLENGKLILFRSENEPSRVHTMHVWQTPFYSEEFHAAHPTGGDSYLATIGNKDLVRGISDLFHLNRLLSNQKPNRAVYEDLLGTIDRIADSYHWLGHDETGSVLSQLQDIRKTASNVIAEFEKVQQLRTQADQQVATIESECVSLFRDISLNEFATIDDFVHALNQLRSRRGIIDTTRDVRYADDERLTNIENDVIKQSDDLSARAVRFLLNEEALAPYHVEIAALQTQAESISRVTDAETIKERLDELGTGLDLLMEIVNTLEIEDSTQRTAILERISEVYGLLNRSKAVLATNSKELAGKEGRAEFGAQFKVLSQAVSNYIGLSDSPEKCDEFLAKLMVQVEELEGRFIDFDDFVADLTNKREEIYDTFNQRKQSLLDDRQRRANALGNAAERILGTISKRARTFETADELNAYFASDSMVMKARSIINDLTELGDSVKADDLTSQLKTAKENAIRHQRDQSDLFEDGNLINFGRHKFSVNTQKLDLTMLPRDDRMCMHLTSTDYFEDIEDQDFQATQAFWNQPLVSENKSVYRCEYLAWSIINAAEQQQNNLTLEKLREAALSDETLLEQVRSFASQRYEEQYERGLHDQDATFILKHILHIRSTCGLLRYPVRARVLALLWWYTALNDTAQTEWQCRCESLIRLRKQFGNTPASLALAQELAQHICCIVELFHWDINDSTLLAAGAYLLEEIGGDNQNHFAIGKQAIDLRDHFLEHLSLIHAIDAFHADIHKLQNNLVKSWQIAGAWFDAWYSKEQPDEMSASPNRDEVIVALLFADKEREPISAQTSVMIDGLLGQHERITSKQMKLRLDEFEERVGNFAQETVPAYQHYQQLRHSILERERERLRLGEFTPRVLTSFVRNRLINEVYLPMIGDNLAKQMGTVGENKRTDLMGMLLLISPPGYGKTTLMEYIASVLGLTFMKINGPAIGHSVVSLDPSEAPNATAAQELVKLNLSLEIGNNVLIYLDDIQHCNPEFLQKFISLCDGQRRIEGVWKGKTRTYDLRGKKVAVVMAGNPYTESGEKFQIPDMLANRADTYNLGDILGGAQEAFELSYLENCLTVNPVLAPIAMRSRDDFYRLIRMVDGDESVRTELEHPYSAIELEEIIIVLRHLKRVQNVLLQVNQTYISSANTSEDYRTEPAFKLQGSYRNMSKLAEKIVPVMNAEELDAVILDHYVSESQTLTANAESNLLKFKVMNDFATDDEQQRWTDITKTFSRKQEFAGSEDDPVANVLMQFIKLNEQIQTISTTLTSTAQSQAEQPSLADSLVPAISKLGTDLSEAFREDDTDEDMSERGKVEIINTLPKYYGKLYEQHIEVLEHTLAPALTAITRHLDQSKDLRLPLKDLVSNLQKMINTNDTAQKLRDHRNDDNDVHIDE